MEGETAVDIHLGGFRRKGLWLCAVLFVQRERRSGLRDLANELVASKIVAI